MPDRSVASAVYKLCVYVPEDHPYEEPAFDLWRLETR